MKKIVIPLIICVKILLAGWWPQGAPSDTDYIKLDIAQGLSDYRLWTVSE